MKKAPLILLAIIVASFILGAYFYPQMPDRMASHWNAAGEVDGYMGKFWGVFLFPAILLILFPVYLFVPRIDPLKKNIKLFQGTYDLFMVAFYAFFLYLYVLVLLWNVEVPLNISVMIVPALAILFYIIGILVGKAKRNYLIGIRTPWTLADDEIWDKVHQRAGKLFKAAAVITLIGLFFGKAALAIMLIAVIGVVLYAFIDSYVLYQKKQRRQKGNRK